MKKLFLSLFLIGSLAQAKELQKILLVLSGENKVSLKSGGYHPTGYFLSEFAIPTQALEKAGYEVVVATPRGIKPTIDKVSDDPKWFKSEEEYRNAKNVQMRHLAGSKYVSLDSLNLKSLKKFSGIFLPGGHAPMEDLYKDADLGRILNYFHQAKKPTALICHAPIALLSAKDAQGNFLYRGYKMTVFSTSEEQQEENAGHLDGFLNFYVQEALANAGGIVTVAQPWNANVVRDRELITGQNPMSDLDLANALIEALTEFTLKDILQKAPVKFNGTIEAEILTYVGNVNVNWEKGYSTFFLGKQKMKMDQAQFLNKLTSHVEMASDAFEHQGLLGYYVVALNGMEIAFQNWESQEAAKKALESTEGKELVADANSFMDVVVYKDLAANSVFLECQLLFGNF